MSRRPFSILVLADLSGQPLRELPRVKNRRLVRVTRESFPRLLAATKPGFSIAAHDSSNAAEKYDVRFGEPDEFRPDAVIARHTSRAVADAILTSTAYRELRATWSGLRWLVDATAGLAGVAVKVLDITKKEVLRDLQRAFEFDQSAIFKKVYEEGLDSFGGDPVGTILADFFFSAQNQDAELAEKLTATAAAALCLLLVGVKPDLFAVRRWDDLTKRFDPRWFRECTARIKWNCLFETPQSRHLALLLPRWRPGSGAVAGSEESAWLHPGYLAAATIARAMNAPDLGAIAANLLPEWGDATQAEPRGTESRVELEWECDMKTSADLASIGFDVLERASLAKAPTAGRIARLADSIAQTLLSCQVARDIYQHIRNKIHSRDAAQLTRAIEGWAYTSVPRDGNDRPLLSIEDIHCSRRSVAISIGWHPVVGFGNAQIRLIGPGPEFSPAVSGPSRSVPRIIVMAHVGSSEPGGRDYDATEWVRGDDLLPFRRKLAVRLSDRLALGHPLEAQVEFYTWRDLEPHSLWQVLASQSEMSRLRRDLANVGFYAHVDQQRAEALAGLCCAGGLEALLVRLQGWRALLKDPEHGAIDPQSVEVTLGGWGFEEDWDDAYLECGLSTYQQWLRRTGTAPGPDCVKQLEQQLTEMDRLAWLQLCELYQLPPFRQHQRVCLATRWLAEKIGATAQLLAVGVRDEYTPLEPPWLWEQYSSKHGLSVVIVPEWHQKVLEATEKTEDRSTNRVLIIPLESAPRNIMELPPELAAAVARPIGTTLILVTGEFLVQQARALGSVPLHAFHSATNEMLIEEIKASAAYQVAAAVANTSGWPNRCSLATLGPALREFSLTCRPFGETLLVSKEC
jgi:hypothetical protein